MFVVPDGALTGLPLGVLVTEPTEVDDKDPSSYRKVPWLARKYAMSTLPSVPSLKALRTFAKRARPPVPSSVSGILSWMVRLVRQEV